MPTATRPSIEQIREQFPSLQPGTIFFENAGGSQVPRVVAEAIRDYMLTSYVQVGAGYEVSKLATARLAASREFLTTYMNGAGVGRATFGASSSQLCQSLADAYANVLSPGDEIIVAQTGHEANAGPWFKLEKRGFTVKLWPVNKDTFTCDISDLEDLLTDRTRIVAFPHTSNLLGDIVDVRAITRIAHAAGARVVVDGVAYAPHRAIDVQSWDVDWYFYSTYKVFGPHMGALYGKNEAYAELTGPAHFFIPKDSPSKWELGCVSHESAAGILALSGYLEFVAGNAPTPERRSGTPTARQTIVDAWEEMAAQELPLQDRLLDYLLSKAGVRVMGPQHGGEGRVGIVSFLHDSVSTPDIVAATDAAGIGIRYGHMYAYRLCQGLDLDPDTGVVRVSFAHYNTISEVERLIAVLDTVL